MIWGSAAVVISVFFFFFFWQTLHVPLTCRIRHSGSGVGQVHLRRVLGHPPWLGTAALEHLKGKILGSYRKATALSYHWLFPSPAG